MNCILFEADGLGNATPTTRYTKPNSITARNDLCLRDVFKSPSFVWLADANFVIDVRVQEHNLGQHEIWRGRQQSLRDSSDSSNLYPVILPDLCEKLKTGCSLTPLPLKSIRRTA